MERGHLVYPRAHGATDALENRDRRRGGLPPRSRGNLGGVHVFAVVNGSTPALTGQPLIARFRSNLDEVHPRAHGATDSTLEGWQSGQGPPPRSRGNRHLDVVDSTRKGSTPALTGQPRYVPDVGRPDGVYPRAHGATYSLVVIDARNEGPPPRSRGNRCNFHPKSMSKRSTPALTGQPLSMDFCIKTSTVHPRAHGATCPGGVFFHISAGPPPRSRGNLSQYRNSSWGGRSTPSLTGQPRVRRDVRHREQVHPRTHGATLPRQGISTTLPGPPPRSRGNPLKENTKHCCGHSPKAN